MVINNFSEFTPSPITMLISIFLVRHPDFHRRNCAMYQEFHWFVEKCYLKSHCCLSWAAWRSLSNSFYSITDSFFVAFIHSKPLPVLKVSVFQRYLIPLLLSPHSFFLTIVLLLKMIKQLIFHGHLWKKLDEYIQVILFFKAKILLYRFPNYISYTNINNYESSH